MNKEPANGSATREKQGRRKGQKVHVKIEIPRLNEGETEFITRPSHGVGGGGGFGNLSPDDRAHSPSVFGRLPHIRRRKTKEAIPKLAEPQLMLSRDDIKKREQKIVKKGTRRSGNPQSGG